MMVVACAGIVRAQTNINQIAAGWILLTFLYRRMARELQIFESNSVVTFTVKDVKGGGVTGKSKPTTGSTGTTGSK